MILFPNGIQGLSDTKWSGVRGSVHRLVGIDYRSEPGVIQAHQKLSKVSATTVDELCKVALPLSDGSTLWFSSISGKIWREVNDTFTLLGTLTIPGYSFKLTNTEDNGKSFDYSAQINIPMAHCFNNDGTIMYVLCNATVSGDNGEIFQYTLSTPWDITSATYASKTFVGDAQALGMFFKPDGTKFYVCEDGGGTSVIEYDLGTPWDITTAVLSGDTFDFSALFSRGFGIFFKPDGTEMYLWDGDNMVIRQYTLATAWDITTATHTNSFSPGYNLQYAGGGFISPDGKNLLTIKSVGAKVQKFELTTAWDITSAVYRNEYAVTPAAAMFGLMAAPDGSAFYLGKQSTKSVYQFDLTGASSDSAVTVLGAAEFAVPDGPDGPDEDTDDDEMTQYVYFATKNWLLRVLLSDIANITNLNENGYLTEFLHGDDTYHHFKEANGRLFITDKYTLCEVNEFGVITRESNLSVREPERITILANFDVDLLVGTKRLDEKSRVLRWDTESETWYGEDVIYAGEIHAFLDEDNYTYAIVGDFGQMHYYDGEKLLKHMRVPGQYSSAKRCKVNANAVGYYAGIPIFGLSNIAGNPNLQGIYSYGQYTKDYNITMDLSFPISSNELTGVEIGAIVVRGTNIYASWKSGTSVGVDKLDWTTKYYGAYIETMVLNSAKDRSKFKSLDEVLADYIEMPANTNLAMQYSKNYAAYETFTTEVDDMLFQLRAKATVPEIGAITTKFTFNTHGNNSPRIENFHVNFAGEKDES